QNFFSSGKENPVEVFSDLNFTVSHKETTAILGQSGSGKSTLLSLIAGLDNPTEGEVWVHQRLLGEMNENQLAKFRAQNIGIVFQQFHLMPHLTALENVSLPLELTRKEHALDRSREVLGQVGLLQRQHHFPHQLSGGECQRVAIARALVVKPALLLADEPTGNLDEKTGEKLSKLFFDLIEKNEMTMILVTHNKAMAELCSRKAYLNEGKLL
ncbi:MAG: ABC transporter ATP-binding protein, partial [Deltaproteobacteria bacterium]|nr:ABC transporter ATP-binding protein [Deltaproteobacteria bacterium]